MNRPKVSVVLQAFNHEAFVSEALDSVLMQRVDFPIEVVVGDDCSTDRTRSIIEAYQRREPERIKPLFPPTPMGNRGGCLYRALLEQATGEYVAVLDGDDFWIRDDKLHRQVLALDAQRGASVCFHDAVVFYDDGRKPAWNYGAARIGDTATMDDLLGAWNIIATCSVLYRNRGVEEYPDWLWASPCPDWAQHILNARHGHLVYLSDPMAAYRLHDNGMWTQLSRVEGLEEKLRMLSQLPDSLPSRYLDQLEYARAKIRALIAIERAVPEGQHVVLVVWDGDFQLLELDGRLARAFPPDHEGHSSKPADGAAAVRDVERSRADGAEFLVIPGASRWWLTHYPDLAEHLDRECRRIWSDQDAVIFQLQNGSAA